MRNLYLLSVYRKLVHFICLAIVLLIVPVSNAQEPLAPPPNVPLERTEEEMRAAEQMAADIASRKPSDFQIEFFIAPDALATTDYLSMGDLLTELDVTPTTDWESFSLKEGHEDTQIVIVDQSALDFVYREWLREAYRSRVIIVGMDLTYEEMAELTGDHCNDNVNRDVKFDHQYWIFYYTYSIDSQSGQEIKANDDLSALIDEATLEGCISGNTSAERLLEYPESVTTDHGFYFSPIIGASWIKSFNPLLMFLTYSYEI